MIKSSLIKTGIITVLAMFNKYYTVVGVNQKDLIYKSNNRSYISIEGHPYEVIGIVGSKKSKAFAGLLSNTSFKCKVVVFLRKKM